MTSRAHFAASSLLNGSSMRPSSTSRLQRHMATYATREMSAYLRVLEAGDQRGLASRRRSETVAKTSSANRSSERIATTSRGSAASRVSRRGARRPRSTRENAPCRRASRPRAAPSPPATPSSSRSDPAGGGWVSSRHAARVDDVRRKVDRVLDDPRQLAVELWNSSDWSPRLEPVGSEADSRGRPIVREAEKAEKREEDGSGHADPNRSPSRSCGTAGGFVR
jgi:hypothetical protein